MLYKMLCGYLFQKVRNGQFQIIRVEKHFDKTPKDSNVVGYVSSRKISSPQWSQVASKDNDCY